MTEILSLRNPNGGGGGEGLDMYFVFLIPKKADRRRVFFSWALRNKREVSFLNYLRESNNEETNKYRTIIRKIRNK
jgi:hypothetical protein